MKYLTYAAAIALFSATTAFAQTGPAGNPGDNSMPSNPPAASAPAPDQGQTMGNTGTSGTTQTRRHTSARATHRAATRARRTNTASQNARENEETARLNQEQLRGGGAGGNGGQSMNDQGMSPAYQQQGYMPTTGNPTGNPFDNGSPQSTQAGGPNCTPDNPSCGTARENPGINSSPQHRLEGASPSPTAQQ